MCLPSHRADDNRVLSYAQTWHPPTLLMPLMLLMPALSAARPPATASSSSDCFICCRRAYYCHFCCCLAYCCCFCCCLPYFCPFCCCFVYWIAHSACTLDANFCPACLLFSGCHFLHVAGLLLKVLRHVVGGSRGADTRVSVCCRVLPRGIAVLFGMCCPTCPSQSPN